MADRIQPKNIVILFDGTSNEISSNRTNILRLFGCLEKTAGQVVYYSPGVGTFGAANSLSYHRRKLVELWGMATGWGLDQNVKEAYRFLVQHYRRNGGGEGRDRIFIFGFSRGAYSARVLAGFINCLGLMGADQLNLLDYAFRAYKAVNEDGEDAPDWAELNLYERMLQPDHPPIRCLGLFDTVASVFDIGRYGPRLRLHAATRENPSVEAVRHAVSIDERRSLFQPVLWTGQQTYFGNRFKRGKGQPQDSREAWFAGVHTDVGGGQREEESGLAKVPLVWMLTEVAAMGLELRETTVAEIVLGSNPKKAYVRPDGSAKMHRSMTVLWGLVEFVPRRVPRQDRGWRRSVLGFYLPLFSRRRIAEGAVLHRSVVDRGPLAPNVPAAHEVLG